MRQALATLATVSLALACNVAAQAAPASPDKTAAFRAAGFHLQSGQWHKCDDPGTASYSPGSLEMVGDLNGDGMPEAVVTEGSAYCYGNTGTAFSLVSKSAKGWRLMTENVGIPSFLAARGVAGWPDIEVGGPGFCFPVYRWNGREYALSRHQYEGKTCRP
jgi:hypothetical protein